MGRDATTIIDEGTRSHIKSLKKHVTILFTDIVDSTKYWDKFGDVQGRMMVDRHNRLLFPIVVKFKGRIIKTIGDSIMAAFAKPEHAMEAAIAMQQTMAMERQGDDTFDIHIRIGIHTGDAIVEKEDVYGDCVNVAARVENVGKGNEILLSQATAAYIDDEYAFIFKRKGWFVPKGKSKKIVICTCDWQNHPLLIDKVIKTTALPVSRKQKIELGLYLAATLGVLYFIYLKYIRFLISDSKELAILYLNVNSIVENHPYITIFTAFLGIILLIVFLRMSVIPLFIMRLIRGGFVFSVGFMSMYFIAHYVPLNKENNWDEILRSSYYRYVEVMEDNSRIYQEPSLDGIELGKIHAGQFLLQTDLRHIGDLTWNKVLIGAEQFGWIINISPPQMGIAEKTVSREYRFYFRYKDLYTFIIAFLCFIYGFWRFRIKPI